MAAASYLDLLRRELHAVRDMLGRLEASEPDDELLRAAREQLGLAIQYAGEVNRRYASMLEEARRALWIASKSRAPKMYLDRARRLIAAVLEGLRRDVAD